MTAIRELKPTKFREKVFKLIAVYTDINRMTLEKICLWSHITPEVNDRNRVWNILCYGFIRSSETEKIRLYLAVILRKKFIQNLRWNQVEQMVVCSVFYLFPS